MSQFGHPIDAMISSFRNNRNLLAKRKRLQDINAEYGYDHLKKNNLNKFRASAKELDKTRTKMKRLNRISMVIGIVIFIFISISVLSIFYLLFF